MKLKHFASVIALGAAALLLASTLAFAGDDDKVGDAAKQKSSQKAKHVYTDEDMPSTRDGSTADSDKPAGDKDSDKAAKPLSLADAKKELEKYTRAEESLTKALETLQQKADAATDPFRKNMYLESIDRQQITLSEFREKRKQLEEQIAAEKEKKQPS